jgi:hypothetical protein
MNLDAQPYLVRPGDNLSSIAQRHGYRDWLVIYHSRCNDALRRQRPDPNLIRPGDRIMLPPRPDQIRAALQERLARLQSVESESRSLFDSLVRELDAEFEATQRQGEMVDVAAEIANILKTLTSMTIRGFQSLAKSGAELDRINRELAKEALDMPKDKLGEVTMKCYADMLSGPEAETMRTHTLWVFGAVAVQSWLDIHSPSYWASSWANRRSGMSVSAALATRPAELHAAAVARMTAARDAALARIQQRIRETQADLARLGPIVSTPLPLR